jgi:hypothetical protein
MTKRKASTWDKLTAGPMSVTKLMAANIAAIEQDPAYALTLGLGDDAELLKYVGQRDVPMVVARVVELTMRDVPGHMAAVEANLTRSMATAARNRGDALATREAALKKLARLMMDGSRTLRGAILEGWESSDDRASVKKWHLERERQRKGG